MGSTRPKKSSVPTPSIEEGQNKTRKEVICSILKKKNKRKISNSNTKKILRYFNIK